MFFVRQEGGQEQDEGQQDRRATLLEMFASLDSVSFHGKRNEKSEKLVRKVRD
jgi:hypothetical protein